MRSPHARIDVFEQYIDWMWLVYVLRSSVTSSETINFGDAEGRGRGRASRPRARYYVGMSCDLGRRIRQHNGLISGGARRTRAGRPWTVIATIEGFASMRAALRAEWRVKRARGNLQRAVLGRARWTSNSDAFASETLVVKHEDQAVAEEVVRIVSLVGASWRVGTVELGGP